MQAEDVEAGSASAAPEAPKKAAPRQDFLVGSVQLVVEPSHVEVKEIPREVDIVETTLGPINVTVYGPRSKPAVVTFHEFGVNHKICFSTFLNYPTISQLLEKYTIYHFDAPGHEEDAKPLDASYQYPTIEGLSQMVHEALEKLSIKRPILLGAGIGATILANYAADHPGNVHAMILISGTAQISTWTETFWNWGEHYWLRMVGNGQTFQNAMIRGYLSTNGFYYNTDLLQSLSTEMSKISYDAVNKLIQTYGKRPDISAKLHKLEIPTIIFAGAESYNLDETVQMFSSFKPGTATWIKVDDSGTLLHLESPAALVQPLELWFKVI